MNPVKLLMIFKLIFCRPNLAAWLKEQAAKSDTPIDDWMVELIYEILGPPKE
jgi:hypothetical protein